MTRKCTLILCMLLLAGCGQDTTGVTKRTEPLRGASSYTPYDAIAMLWARAASNRQMIWTSSGQESGQLLASEADPSRRPDWVLCTQGVVAGLAARGESPVIIASVYVSSEAILPVFRSPKKPLAGARSLFIPRSSIEIAFDRLLAREKVSREDVRIPTVEKIGFPLIASLMTKPEGDPDALDFAVLVDPFITNILRERPGLFELGAGGLYEMHYSLVVRREDLESRRESFVSLIRQFLEAEKELKSIKTDEEFYDNVWGRQANGRRDRLPQMITYQREPAAVGLATTKLRSLLAEELGYLTAKYPDQLQMPSDIKFLVDPTLLMEVAPERVR